MAEALITPVTMKAIVCTSHGAPKDVLQLKSVPIPKIETPTSVLVKILYASMNAVDYREANGTMGAIGTKKPPYIAGFDFAGRVVEKGTDDSLKDRIQIGDLVYGCLLGSGSDSGAFSEYCVVEGPWVQRMPKSLTPLQAASIPLTAQTSYQVILKMALKKTDKLLILGGSTATGLMAIQIAKQVIECSEVIVTSTQKKLCSSVGADRVINYREDEWYQVLKDYNVDCIYDCIGGLESWEQCRSEGVLKKNGWFVTVCGDLKHGETITTGALVGTVFSVVNRKFWGAVGEQQYEFHACDASKNLSDVTALIEAKKIKCVLDEESPYKFEEYLKMFENSMAQTQVTRDMSQKVDLQLCKSLIYTTSCSFSKPTPTQEHGTEESTAIFKQASCSCEQY
eukprot:1019034_1